jgi:hypothetical protein
MHRLNRSKIEAEGSSLFSVLTWEGGGGVAEFSASDQARIFFVTISEADALKSTRAARTYNEHCFGLFTEFVCIYTRSKAFFREQI